MSYRTRRATKAAIEAEKQSAAAIPCVQPCDCNICRDQLIVASLEKLSSFQDDILQEMRERFTSMEKQIKTVTSQMEELSNAFDKSHCDKVTRADIGAVIKSISKVSSNVCELVSRSECQVESQLQNLLHSEINVLSAKIEKVISESLLPKTPEYDSEICPVAAVKVRDVSTQTRSLHDEFVHIQSSSFSEKHVQFLQDIATTKSTKSLVAKPAPVLDDSVNSSKLEVSRPCNIDGFMLPPINDQQPGSEWGWIHVSNVPTNVSEYVICEFVRRRFGLRSVICKVLLKSSQNLEDVSWLSFKVGVKRTYARELLNYHRWPVGVKLRWFQKN